MAEHDVQSRDIEDAYEDERIYYSEEEMGTARKKVDRSFTASLARYLWIMIAFFSVAVLAFLTSLAVARAMDVNYIQVSGSSMEPSFSNSDGFWLYNGSDGPQRDDIVVFLEPDSWRDSISGEDFSSMSNTDDDGRTYFLKRAIAVPGDSLVMSYDGVSVNGVVEVDNSDDTKYCSKGLEDEEYTLGEDEYLMLGDNTSHSTDAYALWCSGTEAEDIVVRDSHVEYYGHNYLRIPGGMPFT